jgi:hypothetical protein
VPNGGPLYRRIEFCRNTETLWHKLQSGHWDWLGVHPKGQFVLGSPRLIGRIISSQSLKVNRGDAKEVQHGVRWLEWSGATNVEPNSDWLPDEEQARSSFERLVKRYEDGDRSPVLVRVWLIQNRQVVDERFIAQTPPPNYQ